MTGDNDRDFDMIISDQMEDIPPPAGPDGLVTPWKRPIARICWGLILQSITLNFLALQYILPVLGGLMLYLGFRSLRGENPWFRRAWILSGILALYQVFFIVALAGAWMDWLKTGVASALATTSVRIVLLLMFRSALSQAYEKAGTAPAGDPLLWAAVWMAAIIVLAITPLGQSGLISILMIVLYILIIRSLYRAGKGLGDVGYSLTATPVRISARALSLFCLALCPLLVGVCSFASNHLSLEAEPFLEPETSELRIRLEEMGFPADILRDLTDESVELFREAVHVEYGVDRLDFSLSNQYYTMVENEDRKPDKFLEAVTVYVEMPEYFFYSVVWFRWINDAAYWNDGFTIQIDNLPSELVEGRLLYEKEGREYFSPIPRLTEGNDTITSIFWNASNQWITKGAASYPFGTENQRGYVISRFRVEADRTLGSAVLNYAHNKSPLRFPYFDTEEGILNGAKDYRWHFTNFHTTAYREVVGG